MPHGRQAIDLITLPPEKHVATWHLGGGTSSILAPSSKARSPERSAESVNPNGT